MRRSWPIVHHDGGSSGRGRYLVGGGGAVRTKPMGGWVEIRGADTTHDRQERLTSPPALSTEVIGVPASARRPTAA